MTLALLALLAFQNAAPAAPPLDTMVDMGRYRVHVVLHRGTVPITVVMESGGGATLEAWAGVDARIAQETGASVVTYERAGFGSSELGPLDLLPTQQIDQLDRMLEALGVPPSRIVVGHSYGGLLALAHAQRHARDVVGVVLVDAMNPIFVELTGDFVYGTVPHIEAPANDQERALKRLVDTGPDAFGAAAEAEPRIAVPMVVLSAGTGWWREEFAVTAWRESHERIVAGWPQRRLVVAEGSRHQVPADRPDLIVDAVRSLIEEVRDH
jgi:pimeloyl-ACP methyl ester carboxylesterase